jgi:hypothetical protein
MNRSDGRAAVERPHEDAPAGAVGWTAAGLFWGCVVFLLLFLATRVARLLSWQHTMDDAYMFVRYADHVVHHGCLSWNVPGQPTYGLTAPAYLAVVIPMHLLAPASPGTAILVSSLVSGALFLALLYVLLARYGGVPAQAQRTVALFTLGALLVGSYPLAFHITSGMDTMFDLAALTALFIAHKRNEQRPTRGWTVALGLATGLVFFVRPDLVIYSIGVVSVGLLAARDRETRRRFALILVIGIATLAVELLATYSYFGLPLPLPFYAKGLHSYTGRVLSVYRYTSYVELGGFVQHHWPLLLVVLPAFAYLVRRRGLRVFSPVELGMAASTVVFTAYYLFFVLQILPHQARFYYPTVPALYLLATRCLVLLHEADAPLVRWLRRLRTGLTNAGRTRSRMVGVGTAIALLGLGGLAAYRARQLVTAVADIRANHVFDVAARYASMEWDIWYRLDEISSLPDDLVLGTTEVGIPSALNPGKRLVDLAGLNDTEVARNGFRLDGVLQRSGVDALYLPHPDYTDLNETLLGDAWFRERYEVFSAKDLDCVMGLAIRRDGKYFSRLHAIATEGPWPRPRIHD